MNLLETVPRSPRSLFAGVAGLGRTTDKARAFNAQSLGDYHYGDCPHDSAVLGFLRIDPREYADKVAELKTDERIEAYVRDRIAGLSTQTLALFNEHFFAIGPGATMPELPDGHPLRAIDPKTFQEYRQRIALGRPDIVTFVDLLDYEDGREVRGL